MKVWLVSILTALMLAPVHAQDTKTPKWPEQSCCCSTSESGQCLITVGKQVDAELEDTYRKALQRWPDPDVKEALEKSQTAWKGYRDANCDAEFRTYGKGTMGPNMFGYCQIRLARERIEELKRIYLPEH